MSLMDKIVYLFQVKKELKEAIEEKGVEVPSNTTFQEYSSKINEIFIEVNEEQKQLLKQLISRDLTNFILPDTITTLKPYSFADTIGTETIDLKNVNRLEDYCFSNSNITNLDLINVNTLSKYSLHNIYRLTKIYIPSTIVLDEFVFGDRTYIEDSTSQENSVTVFTDATEKPDNWNDKWNYKTNDTSNNITVKWGTTHEDYLK